MGWLLRGSGKARMTMSCLRPFGCDLVRTCSYAQVIPTQDRLEGRQSDS